MVNPELDLALRRNRGVAIKREWAESLQAACGCKFNDDDFLSLPETELLKRAFFAKIKSGVATAREWRAAVLPEIIGLLVSAAPRIGPLPIVLFSSVDEYLGGLRASADMILLHAASVWRVVSEDLTITTEDLENGLCVGTNYYDMRGEYVATGVIEVRAWGRFATDV